MKTAHHGDNSTTGRYTYTPLIHADQEIRILHVERGYASALASDTPRFEVQIAQISGIDEIPRYYAISYAWGENVWSGNVHLDGHSLTIPQGAEEALRGVLEGIANTEMEMLPLWIDAVCINQHDRTGEKSKQVGIMDDVYAAAQCVLIWYALI